MKNPWALLVAAIALSSCGSQSPQSTSKNSSPLVDAEECVPSMKNRCAELSQEVQDLKEERKKAIEAVDQSKLSQLNLELNFRQELLSIYQKGRDESHEEVVALQKDYAALRSMLATSAGTTNPLLSYAPAEKRAVSEIFTEFGDLYIKESPVGDDGKAVGSTVKVEGPLPWSGYWYPKRFRYLFEGNEAPLQKFDDVLGGMNRPGLTSQWEKDRYDNYFHAEWEGLCDAWALAAVQTNEPQAGVTFHNIYFSVSDLKALATKMYEGVPVRIFGNRYYGDFRTDGEFQDIRPEAFHRLAQVYLGEKQQFIVVDDDPGPEVWAKPLFSLRWAVSKDPNIANAYNVKAWPRFTNNRNEIIDQLTSMFDVKAPSYSYRLYVDPSQTNDKQEFKVIYGEWTDDSKASHPDYLFLPKGPAAPTNQELAKNLDVLKELLSTAKVLR